MAGAGHVHTEHAYAVGQVIERFVGDLLLPEIKTAALHHQREGAFTFRLAKIADDLAPLKRDADDFELLRQQFGIMGVSVQRFFVSRLFARRRRRWETTHRVGRKGSFVEISPRFGIGFAFGFFDHAVACDCPHSCPFLGVERR